MSKSTTIIYVVLLGIMLCISAPAQAQFSISGTVTDPLAQPLVNVSIVLYDSQGGNPIPWTVTDSTGFYTISSLPAGTYGVGFEPSCSTFLLPHFEPTVVVSGNVTLNVSLQQGLILSGYIRDTAGVGIFNMDLNVYDQATGVKIALCGDRSDTLGYYDIAIPPGTWRIRWRPIGGERYVPIQMNNVAITADTTIDVVMESGFFVTGTIQDQFAGPVFDCDLDFIDTLTGQKLLTLSDNTDASGFYQVTVPAGIFDVNAKPAVVDRLSSGQYFGVSINADTIINFTLYPGLSLSGYVWDSLGTPVVGADIDVWDSNTRVKLLTPWDKTDEFGHYEIVFPAGLFDLGYQPPVSTRLAPVEYYGVTISVDTIINATVPDGLLLSGLVENSFGVPVYNVNIDLEDPVTGTKVPLTGDKTDTLGTFTVVTIPGTYNMQFQPPKSRRLAAVEFLSVPLAQDTTVFIALDSGISVSGTVTDSLGAPFSDVRIFAVKTSNGDTLFTPANLSDTTGLYEIVVLPGTYDLYYQPDSLSGYSSPVVLNNTSLLHDTVINVTYSASGNQPPVLASIGNKTTTEGVLLTFGVSATDVESIPALTYSSLPPGASFTDHNNGTGTFTWTPGIGQAGSYNVTFYATDDSAAVDSELIIITVNQAGGSNQPPVLTPIGNKTTDEGVLLAFGVSATDAESIPVLTTSTLPPGASFTDIGNGTGTFGWTPGMSQAGFYDVTFYATDDSAAVDSEQITITVIDAGGGNQPPVLAPIGNKTTIEGVLLTFNVSATDAESTPVLTTSALASGASFTDHNTGTGTFTWTPSSGQAGSYNVTFYATDDSAAVDSEQIIITVDPSGGGDQPPVLAPIGNQLVTVPETLILSISATDAEGPPVLSTSNPLPGGALFTDSGNGNGSFVWTPDSSQSGSHSVTFYAQDAAHQIDFESISIYVSLSGNCCVGQRGDINMSGGTDVGDLTYLVEYLFGGGPPPVCPEQADVDGNSAIDVGDLTYIVEYLFGGGPPPANCL